MHRLLIVTDFFHPDPGSLEAFFTTIANKWQSQRVEVIFIQQKEIKKKGYKSIADQKKITHSEKQNYTLFGVPFPRLSTRIKTFFLDGEESIYSLFIKRLHFFSPDCILFSNPSLRNYVLAKKAIKSNIPYSLLLHAGNLYNNIDRIHIFNRRFIQKSTTVFTFSWYIARVAIQAGIPAQKIYVLPPSFAVRWKKAKITDIPDWLRVRIMRKTVILSVGPLVPRKGIDEAIKIMKTLVKKHKNIHYVIAGSGPELSYLEECRVIHKLEDHISFTGLVDDHTLGELFRRAYLFLQPGRVCDNDNESLGTVFMEAAWFGVPVITKKMGGIEEVVLDKVSGFITAIDGEQEIFERTNELLNTPKLQIKMGEKAKKLARKCFLNQDICKHINKHLL